MFKPERFSPIDLGQVYPKTHKKHDYGAVLFYFFKCFLKSSVTLDQGFSFFTYMQFRMQHSCHTTCKKRHGQNTVTLQQNNRCKMHSRRSHDIIGSVNGNLVCATWVPKMVPRTHPIGNRSTDVRTYMPDLQPPGRSFIFT